MNTTYQLSCCSTADLTPDHFRSIGVRVLPFHYSLNSISFVDDLGQLMPHKTFYQKLRDGAEPSTSQVSTGEYLAFFSPMLQRGEDILHICFSSGLSGTMQSALAAKQILQEQYPERKLYLVDSLAACSGYGLLMDKLAEKKREGMDIDALRDYAEQNRLRVHHWFYSTDLSYYIKGGRISKTAGAVGTMLGICPLMNMDKDGRLVPRRKIRTRQKTMQAALDCMVQLCEDGLAYRQKCFIAHSDCEGEATALAEAIEKRFPQLAGKVALYSIGPTIGCHTGPGTVALFFWGSPRED